VEKEGFIKYLEIKDDAPVDGDERWSEQDEKELLRSFKFKR
jgi:hypothetical protein